jgi:alkylhydroperoxidase/carboxymuconolactone decarboxylase family protein YurZ
MTTDVVTELDPAFVQLATASIEHAWALPQLTDREKVFLSVTADVCQSSFGLPFELHVRAALQRGVSTADIRAALRFVSYDTGYPVTLQAIERLAEIEKKAGISRPTAPLLPEDRVQAGVPGPIPDAVRARLAELDPHFAEYVELQSLMRSGYEPGTLTVRERAFTTMSVDVHYQTLEDTFRIHVDRALSGDATEDDVRAALRFLAQFGATRAWQAWLALNEHLKERG